jgi:hypothetical protein
LTAQGHPRAIFRQAIERGNVLIAEMAAREAGSLTLEEALALTALVAQKDPAPRYVLRWPRPLRGGPLPDDRRGRAGYLRARGARWARARGSPIGAFSHGRTRD